MKFGFEGMMGRNRSPEKGPDTQREQVSRMKPHTEYLVPDKSGLSKNPDGSAGLIVDRPNYRFDLFQDMVGRGVPLETVLAEFYRSNTLTKREKGMYALETCHDGNLILGAIILARTLAKDPGFVKEELFTEYIPINKMDVHRLTYTWEVDGALGWPPGTSAPASRKYLADWVGPR